ILTLEQQNARRERDAHLEKIRLLGRKAIRWVGPFERNSSNLKGRYWLPYFDLPGGASTALIDIDDLRFNRSPIASGGVVPSNSLTLISWKGFAIEVPDELQVSQFGLLEVDVSSG